MAETANNFGTSKEQNPPYGPALAPTLSAFIWSCQPPSLPLARR